MKNLKKEMNIKKKIKNNLQILFLLFTYLISSSCHESKTSDNKNPPLQKIEPKSYQTEIDSATHLLKNGDIILRRGNDVISKLFTEFNQQDKSFSHCGITFADSGKWYVFHAIGGEDNPNEELRKELFESFINSKDNKAFGICDFQFSTQEINSLHQIVDSFYQAKIPFDMQFDLKTNNRLYCAEMVAKSIQFALKNDTFFTLSNHQGFEYYSTDNIFLQHRAKIIYKFQYQ